MVIKFGPKIAMLTPKITGPGSGTMCAEFPWFCSIFWQGFGPERSRLSRVIAKFQFYSLLAPVSILYKVPIAVLLVIIHMVWGWFFMIFKWLSWKIDDNNNGAAAPGGVAVIIDFP